MTKAVATVGFDYEGIDKDTKGKLVALAGQVTRHGRDFIKAGMEIGEAIAAAHELLAGDGRDGKFKQWVELETGLSRTTAYDWMNAYNRSKEVSEIGHFPSSVALLMAAPSVPDEAIKDFAKQIDKGTKPTVAAAKATLNRFRTIAKKPRKKKPVEPDFGEPAKSEPTKADESEALEAEPVKELTFEEQVKQENGKIESFCRGLTKWFEENCPKVASIDHMGRFDSALAQIKAACGTLRTCKYHDEPCPKCSGNGCSKCEKESDFGAVTVLTYRQLAG